jgi:hypothetical protein
MSLQITLSLIRMFCDGYIFGKREAAVYTTICKDVLRMDPVDSFFHECCLVVNLYNVELAF